MTELTGEATLRAAATTGDFGAGSSAGLPKGGGAGGRVASAAVMPRCADSIPAMIAPAPSPSEDSRSTVPSTTASTMVCRLSVTTAATRFWVPSIRAVATSLPAVRNPSITSTMACGRAADSAESTSR